MSKKVVIGLIIGLIIVVIFAAVTLPKKKKTQESVFPITESGQEVAPTKTLVSFKTKEYIDPSGFKFNYPETLTVSPKNINDDITYSDLKITSNKLSGEISIKATASKLQSISDWLKENKFHANNAIIKDIKLADLQAKAVKKDNKIFIVALDQYQTLFIIEVNSKGDEKFWSDANDAIVSTFAFVNPNVNNDSSSTSTSDGSSDDIIFEGEEVVE